MKLWTIQPLRFWHEAQERCVMTPDPAFVEQDFRTAYDWMKEQMQKRLPSFSGDYPIWAWLERPDLRKYKQDSFYDEPYVLLMVDVPDERVVVSDFGAWHAVLNEWFLALTEEEDELMERLQPMMPEIRQSWERIFEPLPDNGWISDGRKQACIDRLYPHEVVSVTPIKQRRRKVA